MEYTPDFSKYTYEELLDAKAHIDRQAYPERYETIIKLLDDPCHKQNFEKDLTERLDTKFSTFWPRFWAALIDGLLFAVILYIECLLFGVEYDSRDRFLQALNGLQFSLYAIVMHGMFGQTLGKMITQVKVLNNETEDKINLLQALRRESVSLALNASWVIMLITIATIYEMTGSIPEGLAYGVIAFGIIALIWGISEFITMLFNKKRRALHDFIGKTVVVRI